MFAANPIDPSRVIPIAFSEPSGPAVPYPRRAGRARPLAVAVLATGVLAFAAAFMGPGGGVSPQAGDTTRGKAAVPAGAAGPVHGEFRLAPGNNQPPGIVAVR